MSAELRPEYTIPSCHPKPTWSFMAFTKAGNVKGARNEWGGLKATGPCAKPGRYISLETSTWLTEHGSACSYRTMRP